jgi:1-deoxy-D-xylulose-5-phosphate reductoisomerase
VCVLGATGSIGLSTLDVIARHPHRYQVFALTGHSRLAELLALCLRHRPQFAVVATDEQARHLRGGLRSAGLATRCWLASRACARWPGTPRSMW